MLLQYLFPILLAASPVFANNEKELINYYTNLIQETINSTNNYKLATDASRYRPLKDNYSKSFGSFDFVIIGAGSSGTIIANRLSENPDWSVLLLEAGTFPDVTTQIPAVGILDLNSDYNWGYLTTSQTTACLNLPNKQCSITRGRAIGGSTILNGLTYARGSIIDYDHWGALGNEGWSYKDILPYYKKSERFIPNDPSPKVDNLFHGRTGELNVEYHEPGSILTDAFTLANKELGYKSIDYNGKTIIGVSRTQQNTKFGRRWDGGTAFINPILNRTNLKVLPGSYVTKLLIDPITKIATGVQFANNKTGYTVYANKEIILSAGVIGSPQILIHSGVGPRNHLKAVKIPLIHTLEVGSAYLTHSGLDNLEFSTNVTVKGQTLQEAVQDYLNGQGRLTILSHIESIGFYKTQIEKVEGAANIEIVISPLQDFSLNDPRFYNTDKQLGHFTIRVVGLHMDSKGTLRVKSNNPFEYPLINPNLLSDNDGNDIQTIYEGIQIVLKLMQTKAFRAINATLVKPDLPICDKSEYLSKDYWMCVIRQLTTDYLHQVGTCAMGSSPDSGAVVDRNCRVHGIGNLRVADASIVPITMACHTSQPAMVIGEKVSEMIVMEYALCDGINNCSCPV